MDLIRLGNSLTHAVIFTFISTICVIIEMFIGPFIFAIITFIIGVCILYFARESIIFECKKDVK